MTLVERARDIADNVLFPAALAVDAADRVPPEHLNLLAAEGFYGAAADPDLDFAGIAAIVEALASGDMATTLVWIQHLTPVMVLLSRESPLTDAWLPALVAGQRRGGIALAGVRPTSNYLRVRDSGSDFVLDGTVPWVTGWGMIDVVYVAARDADDVVHFLLMDAPSVAVAPAAAGGDSAAPTVRTETQRLVALQASNTVNVTFDGHMVPRDRLVSRTPFGEWRSSDSGGSALNGFLALGVVRRCVALLRDGPGQGDSDALAASADDCRSALLAADAAGTPAARAAASELAWRAAATLTAWQGARSVLRTNQAQRLVREATFTMVFGSRPAIRDALLGRLSRSA
jgi:alkylation response protein AidB-like acyl-CoA dehydrogenase